MIENKKKIFHKNVEIDEINKFSSFSSSWWNMDDGIAKYLHQINPLRLNYIMESANGIFGKRILDVGCGGGILSESMAKEGAEVTGIDLSYNLLEIAKKHSIKNRLKIKYIYDTIENHVKYFKNYYDIITCMEMLEHVPDPESIIKSCAKLLKYNGHLFISTINRNKKSWLFLIFFAEFFLKMLPRGTHDVKKFIKPAELLNWVDQTSLQEQDIIGIGYNPITKKFFLQKSVDVNYLLHLINIY